MVYVCTVTEPSMQLRGNVFSYFFTWYEKCCTSCLREANRGAANV